MRPLSEHPYPRRYDSNSNKSILKEFYIPTLSNSVEYWRVASYFRSSAFLANAPGLAKFINNGGKIKLIVNVKLDKNDYDAIQAGEKNENEFIENYFSTEVEELKISISKKRYKFKY